MAHHFGLEVTVFRIGNWLRILRVGLDRVWRGASGCSRVVVVAEPDTSQSEPSRSFLGLHRGEGGERECLLLSYSAISEGNR